MSGGTVQPRHREWHRSHCHVRSRS
jgi:hypothetical protein